MKFRKKPVVVEAYQFNNMDLWWSEDGDWPEWLQEAVNDGTVFLSLDDVTKIATLEGTHTVSFGDWIIQGVHGELYPCKPDIFEKTYERVEE